MQNVRMILDVDTGIDDSMAILLALKTKHIKVEGITTVFGNTDVVQATRNTLQVIELSGVPYEVPVAMGAARPLYRDWKGPVTHIHGDNGIGNCELPEPKGKAIPESASDFIVRMVNENPHELTFVFVGRMTNLALALAKDPTIASKVKRLVIMGGAVKVPGNVTPAAEANIYGDPEAAHRVFESGIPITLVGLDVTMKTIIGEEHRLDLMAAPIPGNERAAAYIGEAFQFYFGAYDKQNGFYGAPLHDPLAVAVAAYPDLITTEDHYIRIETKGTMSYGATLADLRRSVEVTNTAVGVDVDSPRFLDYFINTLKS
ncbi:nucleoside hydrolase [Paenibacillus marchantiophytorum]|uniref:Nucleoside hydrolase n=1 Tax=Paenibacillus marchantiophytorum TaxID=1619310 RepID=A0ABQ1ESK4_9BACL|nr:nucleoside hydrolase [Paenibacillus marchantiophytorum]GFZ84779.1 nucleoside hydrolase [Paenibacillus marchantiophytorum]